MQLGCRLTSSLSQPSCAYSVVTTCTGPAFCGADIPASRVVAGVRVGLLPELGFVVNPSIEQMEASTLDLTIAGAA